MADRRERSRMVFEASDIIKRAIRTRAAVDGVKPTDVINSALEEYLADELALVRKRLGEAAGADEKPGRARRQRPADGG